MPPLDARCDRPAAIATLKPVDVAAPEELGHLVGVILALDHLVVGLDVRTSPSSSIVVLVT